jgi:hypothetical protein
LGVGLAAGVGVAAGVGDVGGVAVDADVPVALVVAAGRVGTAVGAMLADGAAAPEHPAVTASNTPRATATTDLMCSPKTAARGVLVHGRERRGALAIPS